MNKLLKILLATLAGIETVFSIGLPILVSLLWVRIGGLTDWSSYVLLSAGILASIFRGIKVGLMGFVK